MRSPSIDRSGVAAAGRLAIAAILVAGVGTAGGASASAQEEPLPLVEGRTVLFAGHTDAFSTHLVGDALELRVKDDTMEPSAEYLDPEEVLFQALPSSEFVVPEDFPPELHELTGPPGTHLWLLDQVQQDGLLWPGFETGGVPLGTVEDERLEFHLQAVDGPGVMKMFDTDGQGMPYAVWDNSDGLPDVKTLNTSTHAHLGWVFTVPGLYTLTVEATAVAAGGGALTSGPVDYHFFVGPTSALPSPWAEARGVRALYQGVLERRPDAGGDAYWTGRLASGTDVDALAEVLSRTVEGRTATVQRAYQRALGREPSAADAAFWAEQLRRSQPDVIRARLVAAPEVLAVTGDIEAWVRRALWFALEREPDEAMVDYWTGRTQAWGVGWAGREKVARSILRSPEARSVDVRYALQGVCHRDVWEQPVPADMLAAHLATNLDIGRLRAAVGASDCPPLPGAGATSRSLITKET